MEERKEVLPDPNDEKIKKGDFVDAVAWLIGPTRCNELLKKVSSREDLVREARHLLQMDGVAGGDRAVAVSGKDMAGQTFA